jgi:anti-sigma factor RsiW
MNCAAARDLMLEADRAELEGRSQSELAAHLRDCAACRAATARILDAEQALRHALAGATARRSVDEVVRAAGRTRRRWVWRVAPLAAAAAVVAVLVGRREQFEQVLPPPTRLAAYTDIAVEAPPGRSVAVFKTENPDIVVIWFF